MEYNFKYSLTEEDYAEFTAYTSWYAPWLKKVRLSYVLRTFAYSAVSMTATSIVMDKIRPYRKTHYLGLIIAAIILLLIINVYYYYQAPRLLKNRAKKLLTKEENATILSESEVEMNEDGITTHRKESKAHQNWSSISRYAATKDYFFLYVNSLQGLTIPKRLFRSQQEIADFDKFLTEKIPLSSSFRSLGV